NQTTAEYPRDQLTHQLIEAQAAARPDALALVCGDQSLTYSELNGRANQLAHHLRSLGVGPDELVGVMVDRSTDMLLSTVAVFKAGAAYVPFDPSFPAERLRFMMEDSGVKVLLTQGAIAAAMPAALAEQLEQQQTKVISVDSDWPVIAQSPATNPPLCTTPANLAYVIYTSGSTGRPKGVMLEHRSLVNFLCSMQREPGLTANDTLLAVTTLSFDIAGLELYLPLVTGARVVIARREEVVDSIALQRLLNASGATVMQATPATWRMLIEAGWMGHRGLKVLCGGEALPRELADQLVERTSELWNMYGPTETTIWSTVERVANGHEAISLGKAIANTTIYIVDEHGQLVPRCIAGELYIGGEGLARGYFKREELTAERFVADPFALPGQARMYRTGDIARWRTDGKLEYLGRSDHQVKIRGYRIETEEIEAVLAQHPAVGQVVVVARDDFGGDKRLVAYLVPSVTNAEASLPTTSEWREYLRQQLPEYMVPAVFVTLERLPVTPNGKIDRKQLPAPDERRPELSSGYVPPQNVAEEKIASLWQEALGVEQIGRFDNFFDLGGHSLLMAQVHGRLQTEFKREVSMLDLFRYPTINSLATFLSQEQNEGPQVEQAVVRASVRLNAVRRPRHIRN
ncbi:MAG TPA: amino acid adenylation domain-containing protein, partial [Pyrinomonadaceae bacterium]|nr:amino acid adenylation domain-containing protein [Pyrinomonadaceae bacterium]